VSRARRLSVAGVVAASVALIAPAAVAAQGTDPFPDDQQPIGNEYGLPPLDHPHGSHAGGGGGGASTGGGGAGTAGATGASASAGGAASSGGALTASAVRRGEARNGANAGGGAGAGAGTSSGERLGISDVPPRASLSAGEDTRGGFDVLLIVLAGVAAAGLLLAAILSVGRPGRPAA
jgi:hypothetical protein